MANGGTSQIVAHDRSGTHLWTAGGRGEAPGEYRLITGLGTGPGDSLWIYDFGLRRFTILTTMGNVVRTVSIGASLSAPGAIGRLRDGSFLVKEAWSGLAHGQDALGLERLPVAKCSTVWSQHIGRDAGGTIARRLIRSSFGPFKSGRFRNDLRA